MSTSVVDAIWQQTLATVDGLSLTLNSTSIPAAIGKLPKKEETVDPAFQIVISMKRGGPKRKAIAMSKGSGVTYQVKYPILITFMAPNNDDNTANAQQYGLILQTIANAFKDRTPYVGSVTGIWDTDLDSDVWLDPKELAVGFDYMAQLVTVTTQE